MFVSLAKRLTAWYVFVAMILIVLVVGASSVFAFTLFARATNEAEESGARVVRDYEVRAKIRHQNVDSANRTLLARVERPGLRVRIVPSGVHDEKRILDSHPVAPHDGRSQALFAFGTLIGIKVERVPFLGGRVFITATTESIATVLRGYFVTIVPLALIAALLAWVLGRVITSQALRPLIDVTQSLERFAAGDFTPRSIDVGGKNEFTALAIAYNGAAQQVAHAKVDGELAYAGKMQELEEQNARARAQESQDKLQLAMLQYAHEQKLTLQEVQASLAKTAMQERTKRELAAAQIQLRQNETSSNQSHDLNLASIDALKNNQGNT